MPSPILQKLGRLDGITATERISPEKLLIAAALRAISDGKRTTMTSPAKHASNGRLITKRTQGSFNWMLGRKGRQC